MTEHDHVRLSSPPCLLDEFTAELLPPPPRPDAGVNTSLDWPTVKLWRSTTRTALLTWRTELEPQTRQLRGTRANAHLANVTALAAAHVLAFYWPIRGEIDVRDLAAQHVAGGGIAALPVVTEKHAPIEFWRWEPGMRMMRGFWNIPVPAVREPVQPDTLLIPLVGFDAAGFRLGYGGGYYDRTLATARPAPLKIGIGYAASSLATIYPQPHDVPMDIIVTDDGVRAVRTCAEPGESLWEVGGV